MKLVLTQLSWRKSSNLLKSFTTKSYDSKVAKQLGIFPYEVRSFVEELREKAPKFVEV